MSSPQYSSLRDYLALLRRRRAILIAVTLAFTGAAFVLSASQEKSYEALAAAQYNDIARDASLAGAVDLPPDLNPVVNAFVKTEEVSSLGTARKVQERLDTTASAEQLRGAITTQVDAQSLLVEITASWNDPDFAADVANAFAEVSVQDENRALRQKLDQTIEDLEPRAKGEVVSETGVVNVPVFNARNALSSLSTLQKLVQRRVVVAAEVARRAEVPTAAAAPRTARNTVLGLIVGFAIGLLAAFVRDILDRRIRTSSDAHQAFGLPVLARVGQSALGGTGVAPGANGSGTLVRDLEAFRVLRTNMAALSSERRPRSVLVTSGLAQEGKTTVATSLAAASAAAGARTLLVDADLRRPMVAKRLGLPSSPGLADYLRMAVEPREILQTVPIKGAGGSNGSGAGGETLVCITAGDTTDTPAELLASDRCHDFLEKVCSAYDLVVIDSSPILSAADPLELAPLVESLIICVRLSTSTRDEADAVREAMSLLPERPSGLVVTGADASDGYGYYGP